MAAAVPVTYVPIVTDLALGGILAAVSAAIHVDAGILSEVADLPGRAAEAGRFAYISFGPEAGAGHSRDCSYRDDRDRSDARLAHPHVVVVTGSMHGCLLA
jgi:hypothetical protein